MRICEIASAEDQIALFKLITDKVWQALGDQQRADAEAKEAQPLKAKLKPLTAKKLKPSVARTVPKPTIKAAPPAKPKPQLARTLSLRQQSQNVQAPIAKQNPSFKTAADSKTQNSSDYDSEKIMDRRETDRHS